MSSPSELKQAIQAYQTLISNYEQSRARMAERRRSAADHVMVELDDRIRVTDRTIEALRRAVEMAERHLRLLESHQGKPPSPA